MEQKLSSKGISASTFCESIFRYFLFTDNIMQRLVLLVILLLLPIASVIAGDKTANHFKIASNIAKPVTINTNLGTYHLWGGETIYGHISRLEAFDANGNRIVNTEPQTKYYSRKDGVTDKLINGIISRIYIKVAVHTARHTVTMHQVMAVAAKYFSLQPYCAGWGFTSQVPNQNGMRIQLASIWGLAQAQNMDRVCWGRT